MAGTPAYMRDPPERVFEDYIFTRVVDSSVGLTDIRDSQFTLFDCYTAPSFGSGFVGNQWSQFSPIGFNFSFNGTTYTNVIVTSNGWLMLADPTVSTFAPNVILESILASPYDPWQNHLIKLTDFSTNSVLIAPWFSEIASLANTPWQLGPGTFTNYSSTKISRISLGLEPSPFFLNKQYKGLGYFNDNRSSEGRRFIIRWFGLVNYGELNTIPAAIIKFECVLYENGKIEFRYAPRTAIPGYPGVNYVNEDATIGIFVMDVGLGPRFRDFAVNLGYQQATRKEYIHGGYVYDQNYVDSLINSYQTNYPASASYSIGLNAFQNWPGLSSAGCVMTFSPPLNRRKVLPRKAVRTQDARLTLPTVARTGDDRLGTSLSTFDDRKTIKYALPPTNPYGNVLGGLQWLLPSSVPYNPSLTWVYCPSTISSVVQIDGDSNVTYGITVRVRGVVETKGYSGGSTGDATGTNSDFFYIGGTPSGSNWNIYSLQISNPPQIYYLNNGPDESWVMNLIDYTFTLPINGGATITLYANSEDGQELANTPPSGGPLQIPGISSPVQPYNGQFILMSYISTSIYGSTFPVNYPSTLPRFFGGNGIGVLERQDLFSGDFLVTGSIVKSAAEPFMIDGPTQYMPAFNESNRHDQDESTLTTPFFASGSSINVVGPGFNQSLKSKTQVRVSLPVNTITAMPGYNSSIYYYNSGDKCWEVPANSSYVSGYDGSSPPGTTGGDWVTNPQRYAMNFSVGNYLLPEDYRGFDPIGNLVSSGSSISPTLQTDQVIGSVYNVTDVYLPTSVASIVGKSYAKSIRNNENYSPVENETFSLPITSPFLIEKVVFEIPMMFGAGWFQDVTMCSAPVVNDSLGYFSNLPDMGGPAITVALMRQVPLSADSQNPSYRDIILSGTITHSNDYTSGVSYTSFGGTSYSFYPYGFLAFNNPASTIVQNPSNSVLTGSIMVETQALSTTGLNVASVTQFNGTTTQNAAQLTNLFASSLLYLDNNTSEIIATNAYVGPSIAPYGRSGNGFDQSGRAILGNEHVLFQNAASKNGKYTQNPFYLGQSLASFPSYIQDVLVSNNINVANAVTFVPLNGYMESPYLVMPGDKLVLSISKTRPCVIDAANSGSNIFGGAPPHDVQFNVGNINITFYGSQVSDGSEFHDTLNQPLASDVVHEVLGGDPILDQFEPAYYAEHSGSFTDNVVLGNMLTINVVGGQTQFIQGIRDRRLSKITAQNAPPLTYSASDALINSSKAYRYQPWHEKVGWVRLSQFASNTERFYDSMMPAIDECFNASGCNIFLTPFPVSYGDFRQVNPSPRVLFGDGDSAFDQNVNSIGWIQFDNKTQGNIDQGFGVCIDDNWTKAFPFEPRYANIMRQTNISQGFIAKYANVDGAIIPIKHVIIPGFIFGTTMLGSYITNEESIVTTQPNVPCNEWIADCNISGKIEIKTEYVTSTFPQFMYATGSATHDDMTRALFGFGDNNTQYEFEELDSSIHLLGTNHFPSARNSEGPHPDSIQTTSDNDYFYYSPVIRGWKYGIYNGLPTFSKCYWRRGKFGQFRDMLEQRLFSKFFESDENGPVDPGFRLGTQASVVNVKFIGSNGATTNPESTWSSNLSFECTSSYPYIDGIATNRPIVSLGQLGKAILNIMPDIKNNVNI